MKKLILLVFTLVITMSILQAQNDTVYVMHNGNVVFFSKVSQVDSVIFYKPKNLASTAIDIDGNIYNTITIGTQIWLKENLKTTKYSDGTAIPWVTDDKAWGSLSTPGYCWYNNDIVTNKDTNGAMYNWYSVNITTNGNKNVCPSGWHVPSNEDFTYLSDYLGGASISGGKLKEIGTIHWNDPNTGANNSSYFTAYPSGLRHISGSYQGMGVYGNFWTSSEDINSLGIYWYLQNNYADFFGTSTYKSLGLSVRCIKD